MKTRKEFSAQFDGMTNSAAIDATQEEAIAAGELLTLEQVKARADACPKRALESAVNSLLVGR